MAAAIALCKAEDALAAFEEHVDNATVWGGDYESRSGASLSAQSEEQDLEGFEEEACENGDAMEASEEGEGSDGEASEAMEDIQGSEASQSEDLEGEPERSCSVVDRRKLAREAVDAELGRPARWGQAYAAYVSKDEQEPPKPRGRKPKGCKAKGKTTKKAKAAPKKAKAAPPTDDEEDEESNEEEDVEEPTPPKKGKRKVLAEAHPNKRARIVKDEPRRHGRSASAKAKALPKTKPSAKGKAKAKAAAKAKATTKSKGYRAPCLDEEGYKAKMSRKSGAYHKALKLAKSQGHDEETCKLKAREATR